MGCSSSKKESPLDPSDVQLSGGEPLSQLSGVSRSEQRQSSAANLDPRRHILKVRSSGFHDRGADISWLSAFPGEKEVLFPPLTYLKPTGRAEVVGQCTVVEVTPTLA